MPWLALSSMVSAGGGASDEWTELTKGLSGGGAVSRSIWASQLSPGSKTLGFLGPSFHIKCQI